MFNKVLVEFEFLITIIYIYSKQLVMIVITDLVNTDCEFTMSHHVILKQPLIVKSLKLMSAVFLFWLTGILKVKGTKNSTFLKYNLLKHGEKLWTQA